MAKLYYYNLIPLTNLPFGKQAFFTYSHEQKLEIGQLVIAYLRGRRQRSIVYQLVKSKPKFRIFKITEIVSDQINYVLRRNDSVYDGIGLPFSEYLIDEFLVDSPRFYR